MYLRNIELLVSHLEAMRAANRTDMKDNDPLRLDSSEILRCIADLRACREVLTTQCDPDGIYRLFENTEKTSNLNYNTLVAAFLELLKKVDSKDPRKAEVLSLVTAEFE